MFVLGLCCPEVIPPTLFTVGLCTLSINMKITAGGSRVLNLFNYLLHLYYHAKSFLPDPMFIRIISQAKRGEIWFSLYLVVANGMS